MRRIPVRFTVLAACLLLLNVGGLVWIRNELTRPQDAATGPLRVVETLPAESADQAERLSIVFDRDAGAMDTLNEELAKAALFEFSPKLDGHWEWSTPRRLDFVLAEPLPAGRRFEVVQAAAVEEEAAAIVQVDAEIEFRTEPLKWIESRLISADRSDVTFELKFNQAVAPDELLQHLTIRETSTDDHPVHGDADSSLKPVTLVEEPDQSIVLRCPRPTTNTLVVSLAGELAGHEGELALGESASWTLNVAPHFAWLRSEVHEAHNNEWRVDLYFLPGLKSDQELPQIPVSPAVADLKNHITTTWRGEGRVLRLQGAFESGREYRATLPRTLLSKNDKPLGQDAVVRFRIPERSPSVDFVHRRGILSPDGNLEVELQTVNVGSLHVQLERVHSNNLIAHLQNTWRRRTSRELEGHSLRIDYEQNRTMQHVVGLRDVGAVTPGLYSISARATDRSWTRDRTLVAVTDLAITLKQSQGELLVQVTSLRQGTSAAGVAIRTVSYNNQTLASGTTDADGIVRLPVDRLHPDGRPWAVIAERDEQVAWIRTDDNHFVDDQIDQSGRPHGTNPYDVMLYTERGTYRPGDTIHLTGIIRDQQGQVPPEFPLSVHIVRPDGRVVASEMVNPAQAGAADGGQQLSHPGVFHFDFTTPRSAWTGPWRFRVTLPGSDDELASTHAYVEEFVPVRMEVTATPEKDLWTSASPTVQADARYLFGPAAVGLSGEVTTRYRAVRFKSATYPDFRFGETKLPATHATEAVDFTLDDLGRKVIQLPDAPKQPARWNALVGVTVTEDGGRSVSTQCQTTVDTHERHIGLRLPAGNVIRAGADVLIESVVCTSADGAASFEPLQLELQRVQHEHVMERVNGRLTWRSTERTNSVWTTLVDEAPKEEIAKLTMPCKEAGQYRLIASCDIAGVTSRTVLEFTAVGENGTIASVGRPEQVEIQLDRATCRPGDSIDAVITSPFPGRMLLCLEADRVLWSRVVELEQTSATIPIDVPAHVRGGAFLTATVTRAVDPTVNDWRPHRARGITRIITDHSRQQIPVSIDAPTSAQPGQAVTVTATAEPGTLIHIWAVDEGILATSGFRTPTPHSHFYARRSNGVITSDVFADLLPDYERPADFHRIGGDAGMDSLRRNPVATPRRAAAVIWQAFRPADAQGQLTLKATLPEFTGELRWMAVAVNGSRFGSADHAMQVSSPLLVESSWPRFAAPGDRFRIPVKLFNTTDEPLTVATSYITEGDAVFTSADGVPEPGDLTYNGLDSLVVPFELPGGESRTMWLDVTATRIGPVSERVEFIGITPDGEGVEAGTSYVVSVRPATALSTTREFQTLMAGAEATVDIPDGLLSGASRSTLTLSSRPTLELQPAVDSLLRYPYGCVEQTTSRVRAVLAASDWLHVASEDHSSEPPGIFDDRNPRHSQNRKLLVRELVNAGVSRLWSMQTRSGGLSYWPGQTEPNLWGSIWAAETLLTARDRGIDIDTRLIDGLQSYLADSLSASNGNDGELDSNLRAEVCQVLSRMGKPPMGWLSLLSERLNELDMSGRAQLALAWHHAGRRDRALAALPPDTLDLGEQVSYRGRFSTPTIQRARLLACLLEIAPEHEWVPQLALKLHESRQSGEWLSTIENALTVDALAAMPSTDESAPFSGTVSVGDQQIEIKQGQSQRLSFDGLSEALSVQSRGAGKLYVSFETTGQSTVPPVNQDRRLRVRRRWLDRNGNEIDPSGVRVGDLIQVEVSLSSSGRSTIENVAIVDALPGGLEVENPRLKTSADGLPSSPADRVQFLDDRVLIFATASPSKSMFRYALRAVCEGEFVQPPVQASCMYDESLASIHGHGQVRIAPAVERQKVERLAGRKEVEEATK